jgi:hypothetical protein
VVVILNRLEGSSSSPSTKLNYQQTKLMNKTLKNISLVTLLVLSCGSLYGDTVGQQNRDHRQDNRQEHRGDRQDNRGDHQDNRQDNRDNRQD